MVDMNQLSRLGLFDAAVPRYTSYPPATQFSDQIDASFHGDALAAIPENSGISLYVHVPFCKRLCWFCACRTQGTTTMSPVEGYVETLLKELDLIKARLPKGVYLSRLHWGGGTPTLLSPDLMRKLVAKIDDVFTRDERCAFSVEIDPNEIDQERMETLRDVGMTRASLGVQDFDPRIQETIGRIQTYEVTEQTIAGLRAAGIPSINTDILYGLPYQTPEKLKNTVDQILKLSPDRIALYGYAHVPWMARRQTMIPANTLPSTKERLALWEHAQEKFLENGYVQIGIDHFAKPTDSLALAAQNGNLHRNFQGYTDENCDVILGVGASSISRFPQGYTQNNPSTSQYTMATEAGTFSTARGHAFTDEDRFYGNLIEQLMCHFHISWDQALKYSTLSREELQTLFCEIRAKFEQLPQVDETGFHIKPDARVLTRMIANGFDQYTQKISSSSSAI
jgi:oxygen-independent coproporphyrinogen-3 oxidase